MSQSNSDPLPGDFNVRVEDFVPSLRQVFELEPLDLNQIPRAAVPTEPIEGVGLRLPKAMDRRVILLTDGKSVCRWETDSLQDLFRGDAKPPHLGDCPDAYNGAFALLDLHAIEINQFLGDRTDDEMLEIFSTLRRRPDGRSLGILHDYMWQAAAIILGTRPLSQLEFEAIMSRLERSCRTFRMGPTSRNYIRSIREVFQVRDRED